MRSSTLRLPTCPPAPAYVVSSYPNCSSGTAYPSPPLCLSSLSAAGFGFTSQIPSSTPSSSSSSSPSTRAPPRFPPITPKLINRPFLVLFLCTCTSSPRATSVATKPSSAKLKSALYVLHTLCPKSDSQFSTAQALASVAADHQASSANDTAQSTHSEPLSTRFKCGFRPCRMCNTIVSESDRIVRMDTASSYYTC